MSTDPRQLVEVFQDLSRALLRWTSDLSNLERDVQQSSNKAMGAVEDIEHRAQFVETLAKEAFLAATAAASEVEASQARNQVAQDMSSEGLEESHFAETDCQNGMNVWANAVGTARGLLSTAQRWLSKAVNALGVARSRLSAAQSELSAARSALSYCQSSYTTDKDGRRIYRNCSSENGRVSRASNQVTIAQSEVRQAQTEVSKAEAEVTRCTGLVNACESGLLKARRLQSEAKENVRQAERAVDDALRAQAELNDAASLSEDTIERCEGLVAIAEEVMLITGNIRHKARAIPEGAKRITVLADAQRTLEVRGKTLLRDLDERLRTFNSSQGGP